MMAAFCGDDPRLVGVGFLPLNDPERSLDVVAEAVDLGCGALWVAHAPSAGRSPAHVDNDPVWAAVVESGLPIVLHIGAADRRSRASGTATGGRVRSTSMVAARTCERRTSPRCTTPTRRS